ncbi:hypothetical protein LTR62_007371 [Meristemomyces frigidus]|uniref:FAD-binding domain-containing protein n=1 Tax=Meristemomyces frigidus TaxID=1508187 RepID=A0AAN7TQ26_9PEZI|nr:hypothetical protein LTR62_007371 [Meristemomyces frigidus]
MPSKPKCILIAGAGIAGPALALLLSRNNHLVVIVERSPASRTNGQQIDLADLDITITKALGFHHDFLARTVGYQGVKFVNDGVWASFPEKGPGCGALVREVKILTGELTGTLFERTRGEVE